MDLDRRRECLATGGVRVGVTGVLRERRDDTARTVSLGLLYEPTPITPAPSGTILDGGTL